MTETIKKNNNNNCKSMNPTDKMICLIKKIGDKKVITFLSFIVFFIIILITSPGFIYKVDGIKLVKDPTQSFGFKDSVVYKLINMINGKNTKEHEDNAAYQIFVTEKYEEVKKNIEEQNNKKIKEWNNATYSNLWIDLYISDTIAMYNYIAYKNYLKELEELKIDDGTSNTSVSVIQKKWFALNSGQYTKSIEDTNKTINENKDIIPVDSTKIIGKLELTKEKQEKLIEDAKKEIIPPIQGDITKILMSSWENKTSIGKKKWIGKVSGADKEGADIKIKYSKQEIFIFFNEYILPYIISSIIISGLITILLKFLMYEYKNGNISMLNNTSMKSPWKLAGVFLTVTFFINLLLMPGLWYEDYPRPGQISKIDEEIKNKDKEMFLKQTQLVIYVAKKESTKIQETTNEIKILKNERYKLERVKDYNLTGYVFKLIRKEITWKEFGLYFTQIIISSIINTIIITITIAFCFNLLRPRMD